jgi:hypothetical protein
MFYIFNWLELIYQISVRLFLRYLILQFFLITLCSYIKKHYVLYFLYKEYLFENVLMLKLNLLFVSLNIVTLWSKSRVTNFVLKKFIYVIRKCCY